MPIVLEAEEGKGDAAVRKAPDTLTHTVFGSNSGGVLGRSGHSANPFQYQSDVLLVCEWYLILRVSTVLCVKQHLKPWLKREGSWSPF